MNNTDARVSSEIMLSKYRLTWRHNPQGHKTDTIPREEIHLIEAERQFSLKFYLNILIIL
jgi:hypothetical protein